MRYATGVPYTPQGCASNLQEPFAVILPHLNKTFFFSKVVYISQEEPIFTSNLSTVRRDFLMQVQATSGKDLLTVSSTVTEKNASRFPLLGNRYSNISLNLKEYCC